MAGLKWIAFRVCGWVGVFHLNVVLWEFLDVGPDAVGKAGMPIQFIGIPGHGTLHLMKDRVVAAVDCITAVDVGGDQITRRSVGAEGVSLMSGGVGAQDRVFIDVVGVTAITARMINRKAERVEVLIHADNREEIIVGLVARETRLDELTSDGNGMVRLKMQSSRNSIKDALRCVHPFVRLICAAFYSDGLGGPAWQNIRTIGPDPRAKRDGTGKGRVSNDDTIRPERKC
ncbi:hypothetical protein MPH_01674 [Macrophomina phaseolina MS6]|uniref:Uncharacterized protein n=1 Tax=Macrophomina phaseolina (strain MS6) TaxID=1126212 RepID=K2SX08_MACPH|nr:hypothetical protein MPH_01674 [Macrophomina phaseolina MS6]